MADWPTLRFDFNSDITETQDAGFIRTETETGPALQMRRYSAISRYIEAEVMMLPEDRLVFDAWYRNEINNGAGTFNMRHPATGQNGVFRFVEPPTFTIVQTQSGPGSIASVYLEMLP